jgi:hypothetical protein
VNLAKTRGLIEREPAAPDSLEHLNQAAAAKRQRAAGEQDHA